MPPAEPSRGGGPSLTEPSVPLPEPHPRAAACQREAKGMRSGLGRRGRVLSTRLPGMEAHSLLHVSGLQAGPGSQLGLCVLGQEPSLGRA